MKKIILLSSALLSVVFLAGCGTQPTTPAGTAQQKEQPVATQQPAAADETADWKTYTNSDYGFSVQYPAGWIISDDSVDMSCKRHIGIMIYGPLRDDLPGYLGVPVQYRILISVSDTMEITSIADFGAPSLDHQSSWNVDISKFQKEQTAEYKIGQQIISSFVQGVAKPPTSTFQKFFNGDIRFNYPCDWETAGLKNPRPGFFFGKYGICPAKMCVIQGGTLVSGTPPIVISEEVKPLATTTPANVTYLGQDPQGNYVFTAQLNDPAYVDAYNQIIGSFKIEK